MRNQRRLSSLPPIRGGERTVEAFASVKLEDKDYWFFLVDGSLRNSQPASTDLLWRSFGRALTDRSVLVRPYEDWKAYDEVLEKQWPDKELEALRARRGPFLLVIDKPFADFDPRHDACALLWLQDFGDDGGDSRVAELDSVLSRLAAAARNPDEDPITLVRKLAEHAAASRHPGRASVWANASAATLGTESLIGTPPDSGRE